MSLFDKLNNKRYDLQEIKKKTSSSASSGNNKSDENISTSRKRIKKAISDLDATQPKIETGRTTYSKNKNINQEISQRRTAQDRQQQLYNRQYDAYDDGDLGNPNQSKSQTSTKTKPKTNVVKQSEVSQKAKEFTKEINKKNKNRTFFDPEKAKEARKNLIAKRKEYGIDRKGNISDAGVKRYAQKTKQLSSGSNLPVTPTKKELKVAKIRAVGGEKVTNKSGKVIGTTTGKYGGRLPRARNKNMKTYDQIKKEIDLKDLQKASNYKAAGIARSKELKRLNKEMGEKALKSKIQSAKTFAPSTKADRQFYKAGTKLTKLLPKKAAPVAKKGLKLLTKAGPAGRIAGAVGLALLSPGVRKTAAKVLGATAVGLGISKAAGSGGGKTPIKPTVTRRKYGINLSQKDNK